MSMEDIQEYLVSMDASALSMDRFDDAAVGVTSINDRHHIIYDRDKCISILMDHDGMSHEDAEDFFCYNTERALDYLRGGDIGEPIIMQSFSKESTNEN